MSLSISKPHPLVTHFFNDSVRLQPLRCLTVDTEDLVEDPTGTISVAILKAVATTPVAIPTGMTTYGLDIVVKFGAVRRLLWQSRFGPLTFE